VFANILLQAETQNHKCEFMYGDFCYIDEKGQKIKDIVHDKPQGPKDLIEGYDVGMAFMYTKNLWNKVGPYWTRICEDFHWTVRAAAHTNFGLIRGVLAAFRIHSGQISGNKKEEEKATADECKRLAREMFGNKFEDDTIMPFANKNP
jgi:hypothetical protein